MRVFFIIVLIFSFFTSIAQEKAIVFGKIVDEKGNALELVNVAISGLPGGAVTDRKGKFELEVPSNTDIYIVVSFVGYEREVEQVLLAEGERQEINKTLKLTYTTLPTVKVESDLERTANVMRIDPNLAFNITSATGGIPSLIKTLPGVSSNNELSSQYSVRGGNFDENLIYVNDIEIYRPFLVRSGQQEGLSFVNSDLVSSLLFSAGGFDAKYGDKMSSVLDLKYKTPTEFGGSASISLLGASLHLEGATKDRKFTYLTGFRYKSNQYLLNSLETKGDYKPVFLDFQALLTYNVSKKVEISFLGNLASNKYQLAPQSRETDFGTVQQAQRLTIYFEGQEVDNYFNYLGGVTTTYKPNKQTQLKLIVSGYNSQESETYDILGQYWIGRVETNFGSENYGEVVETQGVGSYLNHARNYLDVRVVNIAHKGNRVFKNQFLQWGVKYQREFIDDEMNEWILIDSAGYSLPHPPDTPGETTQQETFEIYDLIKTSAEINSNRYTGFIQNSWSIGIDSSEFTLTAGIRGNYWDYNDQLVVSPRATASYKPNWKRDLLFRLSAGWYYQPPFYRELKDLDGTINSNQKAQASFQIVGATDWNMKFWGRPFKFTTEVYYKSLNHLIPYQVDNVRIRYYAFDQSKGYATGIDFKINGEFVKGIESWASLSIMGTREDIIGDYYYDYYEDGTKVGSGPEENPNTDISNVRIEPGYIPRPTDQRVNFSIFFQDYLPMNPTYKMSLTLVFGSSLPFGPPQSPKYKHTLRMPPYRRVDIGFSKELIGEHSRFSAKNPFRVFKSMWITAEILNLLQVNNTVSYIWVTDVYGRQYAVPNYLTPRQLNIKLAARF